MDIKVGDLVSVQWTAPDFEPGQEPSSCTVRVTEVQEAPNPRVPAIITGVQQ